MSRSRRPFRPIGRLAVVVAAACLTAGLTACEAGNNAATLTQYHPANDGANTVAHGIKINDAFVLGAPIGSTLAAGQNAAVFLALFNIGRADRLVSADAPGTAASVQLPPGGIVLPSQRGVYLTGPASQDRTDQPHPSAGGRRGGPRHPSFHERGQRQDDPSRDPALDLLRDVLARADSHPDAIGYLRPAAERGGRHLDGLALAVGQHPVEPAHRSLARNMSSVMATPVPRVDEQGSAAWPAVSRRARTCIPARGR